MAYGQKWLYGIWKQINGPIWRRGWGQGKRGWDNINYLVNVITEDDLFHFLPRNGMFLSTSDVCQIPFLFFISLVLAISLKLKVKSVDISEDSYNYLCYPIPSSPVPFPLSLPSRPPTTLCLFFGPFTAVLPTKHMSSRPCRSTCYAHNCFSSCKQYSGSNHRISFPIFISVFVLFLPTASILGSGHIY